MKKAVICIPNISEGRDQNKIRRIVSSVADIDDVKLLCVDPDSEHNRTVITFAGRPEDVLLAAYSLIFTSLKLIDMRHHKGEHPRFGAVDVCPFVPASNMSMGKCVELARRLARAVGNLRIPVYLYGEAALCSERKKVADIRKGEYEGLEKKLRDPECKPDFGPAIFQPKAGAIAIGARGVMVAFNVNLDSCDLSLASDIAKLIRGSSGGAFPTVQARKVDTRTQGYVQVSMNLHNYRADTIGAVFSRIKFLTEAEGVKIHSSEIIGAVPRDAFDGVWIEDLMLKNFNSQKQIIEEALGL